MNTLALAFFVTVVTAVSRFDVPDEEYKKYEQEILGFKEQKMKPMHFNIPNNQEPITDEEYRKYEAEILDSAIAGLKLQPQTTKAAESKRKFVPNDHKRKRSVSYEEIAEKRTRLDTGVFDVIKREWESDTKRLKVLESATIWTFLTKIEAKLADNIKNQPAFQNLRDIDCPVDIERLQTEIMLCLFDSLVTIKNVGGYIDPIPYISLQNRANTSQICSHFTQAWLFYNTRILSGKQYTAITAKLRIVEEMRALNQKPGHAIKFRPMQALRQATEFMVGEVEQRSNAIARSGYKQK